MRVWYNLASCMDSANHYYYTVIMPNAGVKCGIPASSVSLGVDPKLSSTFWTAPGRSEQNGVQWRLLMEAVMEVNGVQWRPIQVNGGQLEANRRKSRQLGRRRESDRGQ